MKANPILPVIIATFFFSCSSGNSGQNTTSAKDSSSAVAPAAYDNSLTKGKVTDSIVCKNQGDQSYALYLPSYYSPDKSFPCIYFFDAHARGALPVTSYKNLAEKYGFVLVGSNISRNGMQWPAVNGVAKTLMDDTRARIHIDPKRIYTSGFSGGSRVAGSVAIYDGGIAGVIGCAAGFPLSEDAFHNKFDYFGMVGDDDFNLTEMERLDDALAQNGFTHQLLTYHGKHGWAPVAGFETALLWIQVNAMKENTQPKNDSLIAALKNDYDKRISAATAAGDLVKEHELIGGLAMALDGLTDVSSYRKQLANLNAGPDYKNAVAIQAQLQQVELNEQQELVKQFTAQNEKWWEKKIGELNHNIHSAKTPQQSQMNQRLLNFLGLVGYMNTSRALSADGGNLVNAAVYLKIFKMADPKNPDCSYLSAIYYMQKSNPQEALSALSEAASLGYSDLSQLLTDPTFSSLSGQDAFKKVINKIQKNNQYAQRL